jgi:hypothetical protein
MSGFLRRARGNGKVLTMLNNFLLDVSVTGEGPQKDILVLETDANGSNPSRQWFDTIDKADEEYVRAAQAKCGRNKSSFRNNLFRANKDDD